jgi:molecular chaperone HtpG
MSEESTTYDFQAEVSQLLDLVIHNLYSDKEIFLRELVSNASDALDRARVMRLSRQDLRAADGEAGVTVSVDEDAGTITVSDNGVGLTAEQAREHLGTIARSGTKAFAKALEEGVENNLIGQFGVGFYSALMVADRLEVDSLSIEPDAEPVLWSCEGAASYKVAVGARETPGTTITLHVREGDREFLSADRLREIIRKHSEYIGYPIHLDGVQINEPRALWTRQPSEVEDDEYKAFYKHLSHDWSDPATWLHFHADAPLQFKAALFFPERRPFDLDWTDGKRHLKLYARRVLIVEEARDLLPTYLRFVSGVVDSEDIQLNVSREMVQKTPLVEKIKQQLTSRTLRHLKSWAKQEEDAYDRFWREFGATLKEGMHSDRENHKRLLPLLRFNTTRHSDGEGLISLERYVADMPEDQEVIYYLTGPDRATCARSPHLEVLKEKGWEVLLLTDPVDEWMIGSLSEYEGKKLQSVARGELDLERDEEEAPEALPEALTGWLGELLDDQVKEVRSSSRLKSSASVLVDDEYGMGANMERILRKAQQDVPTSQRILEVNPNHPLVKALGTLRDQQRPEAEVLGRLLLDQAQLVEGEVADPAGLVQRLEALGTLAASAITGAAPAETPAEASSDEGSEG